MSSDLFKKFVVDIQYKSLGSGTIFKPYQQSIYAYIFTAKHIFFQDDYEDQCKYKEHNESSLKIDPSDLKIIRETNKETIITIKDSTVYFLPDCNIDFAFLIVELNKNKDSSDIKMLEIFDLDSNDHEKIDFYILGYPNITRSRDTSFKLMSYKVRHEFNDDKDTENGVHLKCLDNPVLSLGNFKKDMDGISGAGTYVRKDNMTVNLSHIQYGSIPPNKFTCTRIDILCDDINTTLDKINLNLPKIQTSTRAVLNNEMLDFSEFTDFAFFEEKIKNNTLAYEKHNFGVDLSDTTFNQKIVRDSTRKLREAYEKISLERNALSYFYAHFAILAHKNNARRATTMFFKKAIQLNPEHEQIFLIEKAKRSKNIEELQSLVSKTLPETIEMYNKIISNEETLIGKIHGIKSAIIEIESFDNGKNSEEIKEKLDIYFSQLEKSYEENKETRDSYKYKELGDFYIRFEGREKQAAFSLNIANELLLRLPASDNNKALINEVKERLRFLSEQRNCNIDEQIEIAKLKATSILASEEDKEMKKMVEEMKIMITSVYDDIYHIKQEDAFHKESLSLIKQNIGSLGISINEQIKQNRYNNIDIDLSNENNELVNSISTEMRDHLKEIPKEYNLTLNNEVKNEITSLIMESSDKLTDTLSENNQSLLKKTNNIIDAADKQIKFLLNDAKKDREDFLASINQETAIAELQSIKNKIITEIKKSQKITKESIKKSRIADHKKHLVIENHQKIITRFLDEVKKLEPLVNKKTTEAESNFTEIKNNLQSIKESHDAFSKNTMQALQAQHLKSDNMEETLTGNHIEISNEIFEAKNKIINLLNKHHRSKKNHLLSAIKLSALIALLLGLGFILDNY